MKSKALRAFLLQNTTSNAPASRSECRHLSFSYSFRARQQQLQQGNSFTDRSWSTQRPKGQKMQLFVCFAESQRAAAFPAGRRQAKVQLPACFVSVDVADISRFEETVGQAISAGATGVILLDSSDMGECSTLKHHPTKPQPTAAVYKPPTKGWA